MVNNVFFGIFGVLLLIIVKIEANIDHNSRHVEIRVQPNGDLNYTPYPNYQKHLKIYPQDTVPYIQPQNDYSNNILRLNNPNYRIYSNDYYHNEILTPHEKVAIGLYGGWCIKIESSSQKKILVCCDGYVLSNVDNKVCLPVCKNCKNGVCVGPDNCDCFPGFIKSLNGDCVHTCPLGCLNGKCHSDGTCTCNVGYRYLNSSNNQICEPICSLPCGYLQNCTAPDTCGCINGYAKKEKDGVCQPVCDPPCADGGQCIAGKCSCNPGYNLIDGTCQRNCPGGCKNGHCNIHNSCQCDQGWMLVGRSKNICVPICSNCGKNSKCIAPERCECYEGYESLNGECEPKCKIVCPLHSKCVAVNTCQCDYGYVIGEYTNECRKIN